METKAALLRIDRIFEFYDVPQLFTARDAYDTLYLCLLYADDDECRYMAIRISQDRLRSFTQGTCDLRTLFVSPEQDGEYYDVACMDGGYTLMPSHLHSLPEDRLPDAGYVIKPDATESIMVSIPSNDKPLFRELVRKFGWVCM